MITINPSASSSNTRVTSDSPSVATASAVSSDNGSTDALTATSNNGIATVSILARQLNEAAIRAEIPLGQQSADSLEAITDNKYFANKAQHDAEIPTTRHPELLARARQATGFLNGHDSNPFNGLGRDQLNLIARDNGGAFTVNERRAAWESIQSMESSANSGTKSPPATGYEIMISRLFRGSEPPVAHPPATFENGAQRRSEFLTRDDRALISDMYAHAQSEGADLRHVDLLVHALANYRHYSDGRQLIGSNGYYVDEYWTTFDFKPEDAAIASSVLTSSAFSSTRIDQGFVRHILSPDNGAFTHIGGIPFLERMVKIFSSEGADQPPLGSEFATFEYAKAADHIVTTTHKDIKLPPSKVITEVVNGVWNLTEYGKAAGYTMDKSNGRIYKVTDLQSDQAQQRSTSDVLAGELPTHMLLGSLADTRDPPKARWIWPGHLFKLMKNFKP